MNPWAILGIILALSAIGGGIFTAGKRWERAATVERDNEALRAALDEVQRLQAEKDRLEIQAINDVHEADTKANKEITDAYENADRVIADSGKRQLRNLPGLCAASNRSAAAQAGSAARAAAETDGAELRRAYAEPFIRLAADANKAVIERNECVAIASKDRERQEAKR